MCALKTSLACQNHQCGQWAAQIIDCASIRCLHCFGWSRARRGRTSCTIAWYSRPNALWWLGAPKPLSRLLLFALNCLFYRELRYPAPESCTVIRLSLRCSIRVRSVSNDVRWRWLSVSAEWGRVSIRIWQACRRLWRRVNGLFILHFILLHWAVLLDVAVCCCHCRLLSIV